MFLIHHKTDNITIKFNDLLNILTIEKNKKPVERFWFNDLQHDTFKKYDYLQHAEYNSIVLSKSEFLSRINSYIQYFINDDLYKYIEKQLYLLI